MFIFILLYGCFSFFIWYFVITFIRERIRWYKSTTKVQGEYNGSREVGFGSITRFKPRFTYEYVEGTYEDIYVRNTVGYKQQKLYMKYGDTTTFQLRINPAKPEICYVNTENHLGMFIIQDIVHFIMLKVWLVISIALFLSVYA